MSHDNLVFKLTIYLQIENAKTGFFNFNISKQGMLKGHVFTQLKKFETDVQVINKFVSLLNHLLVDAETSVYIKANEVQASLTTKKALVLDTSVGVSHQLVELKLNKQQRRPCLHMSLMSPVM